jgi:hypothetical protein
MTDKLLQAGWGETGDAGRAACREAIAAAGPAENAEVGEPDIADETATVWVEFTFEGQSETDELGFVRQEDGWLIDTLTLVSDPNA